MGEQERRLSEPRWTQPPTVTKLSTYFSTDAATLSAVCGNVWFSGNSCTNDAGKMPFCGVSLITMPLYHPELSSYTYAITRLECNLEFSIRLEVV